MIEHTIDIRVGYQETDAQGHVHHAEYLVYFERGRVELLRAAGYRYRDLEADGLLLVIIEAECRYVRPADFDDLLQLQTRTTTAKGARVEHRYRLTRGDELLAEGRTVVACVNRDGRVRRLPPFLLDMAPEAMPAPGRDDLEPGRP